MERRTSSFVAEGVPVGESIDVSGGAEAAAHNTIREVQSRLRDMQRRELRHFQVAMDCAVEQACARVADAVGTSIDKQIEPALCKYIAAAPQTVHVVKQVTASLAERVECNAAQVISRLASEEVATRALTDAVEARLKREIDERIGGFWRGALIGASVGCASLLFGQRIWHSAGQQPAARR